MSDKDLQRVTECVSEIGQASARRSIPTRRNHITQKVKIAGQRALCLSVHNDEYPTEIAHQQSSGRTRLRPASGPSLLSQTTHSDSLAKKLDPSHNILADW